MKAPLALLHGDARAHPTCERTGDSPDKLARPWTQREARCEARQPEADIHASIVVL